MYDQSLLPDDYLQARRERRVNLIALTLFAVVMTAVFAAFLVTNRQWSQVREAQRAVDTRFEEVRSQIDHMEELREARKELVQSASLAASLIEPVPRSALLAELIQLMPDQVSWLAFELEAAEVKRVVAKPDSKNDRLQSKRGPRAAKVRQDEAADEPEAPKPKEYRIELVLRGLAPKDAEVSAYINALVSSDLLRHVEPRFTETEVVNDVPMRKFEIAMELAPNAFITAEEAAELKSDPMSDEVPLNSARTAVPNSREDG